ncbi:DUF1702 family protein [Actinomadura geliboluensis]|uniref:DUF1702 family protein n=1 Tax=Actinomadura geliboluensis TaxID=882440 RepID=UPI0037138E1C
MNYAKRPPSHPVYQRLLALDGDSIALEKMGHIPFRPMDGAGLQDVVDSFAAGYNAALARRSGPLDLADVPHPMRGFAYEGAAMSRTLLDLVTLTSGRRLAGLLAGPGRRYFHLITVGAGWAFARLRVRPWRGIGGAPAPQRWLAWDGWGFHQAYFHPGRVFGEKWIERAARGAARPVRDQGAGRALWFHAGADPERVARTVAGFPAERRPDLWAGVGLAAAYTGVRTPDELAVLGEAAAEHRAHVAQGAAFAAKAHLLSGRVPERSEAAVAVLCGTGSGEAAGWTDARLVQAARYGDGIAAYQHWRAGVRAEWAARDRSGGVVA